jgi:hypothetical protein
VPPAPAKRFEAPGRGRAGGCAACNTYQADEFRRVKRIELCSCTGTPRNALGSGTMMRLQSVALMIKPSLDIDAGGRLGKIARTRSPPAARRTSRANEPFRSS